jgi:predicted dithiol-disulfide oxidoreductase (DUF899 family)
MTVPAEQEWQAARRELLVAEHELVQHAELVREQRWDLLWVPVETEYGLTAPLADGRSGRSSR